MQLTRALVVVAIAVSPASGDTGFASKVQVYTDNDHTQVVSPVVDAQADVTPDTNVSVGYLVDAVSSASVDVVSQASPRTMHDTRHEVSLGGSHSFDALKLTGGYSFSKEHDYLSHTIGANVSSEMFDKNTTLAAGVRVSLNTVGRSGDENFARDLTSIRASASWTQILSARFLAQLTYELDHEQGFQSSPYRFVPIRMNEDAAPTQWVMETDPDSRWRHAFVIGANRAVGERSSVQGDYRIYTDDWGITSHTIGARYFAALTKDLELRLRERFYTQSSASFYQRIYTMPQQYITFDRELSALWSQTFGIKLDYRFTDHIDGELKADLFYYSYSDFAPLRSRTGANLGLGVSLTY
jgi:hypothetical protein